MHLLLGVANAGPESGLYGGLVCAVLLLYTHISTLITAPANRPHDGGQGGANLFSTTTHAGGGLATPPTVVIMAGVFQILFGLLRVGHFVTMMPYTVVSGFMSGIGMILIILQIGPFLGFGAPPGGIMGHARGHS
jgi:Sulfate permease and related transporters (MFS superfamily)